MINKNVSNQIIVFIDWGTTNFRAYKFDLKANKVLKKIETDKGILNLKNRKQYINIINGINHTQFFIYHTFIIYERICLHIFSDLTF